MNEDMDRKLQDAVNSQAPLTGGDALRRMAGKTIREICYKKSKDGSINRLVLITADYEEFFFTVQGDNVEMISASIIHEAIGKLAGDKTVETIDSGLMDPDFSETDRVNNLFHALWTKAAGAEDYVKKEWQQLGDVLDKAGYRREK
ncbi:MAG: hypothetical protein OEW15_11435 [Nitrospirota bacterium]|nr:hypothetical protein [Nitrospirota bacterium]